VPFLFFFVIPAKAGIQLDVYFLTGLPDQVG